MQDKQGFFSIVRAAVALLLLFTVLLGGIYPLTVWGIANIAFAVKAEGSLLRDTVSGHVLGSSLLGQHFSSPKYFWGRLSATEPPYNAAASGGSNFSTTNPKFYESLNRRVAALRKYDPNNKNLIPADLVTASASGLDPHISVAAAEYQIRRIAKARGRKESDLQELVRALTEDQDFGLLGEQRVNVLRLNMALDKIEAARSR